MLLQHWQQLGADPIPRHPVAQVQGESGLSRSAFYKRMAQAGIRPICVGQHSYLEPIHLQVLRELAQFLDNGRHPEDFPGRLQPSPELAVVPSPQPVLEQLELEADSEEDQEAPEELVAAAVCHLDGLLSFLTKAAHNSWELPTSQVQLLVGAKPRGTSFSRYGFSFRPAGKHGQETSWRMER